MGWSWNIESTPTFRALSYDDYAKPLEQATKFHQELEEQYGELDAQASEWDKLANDVGGKNSQAYQQYKNYANDLRAQAEELSRNGLGVGSRKAMLNMKARYNSEINPIKEAWDRRQKMSDEQRKLLAEHPELMTDKMAGRESIDFFMHNPNWNYQTINKEQLYKKYAGEMSNFKKQVISEMGKIAQVNMGNNEGQVPSSFKWVNSQIKGFYERARQYGFTPETLKKALEDDNSYVSSLLAGTVMSSGINDMNFGYSYDDKKMAALRKQNAINELTDYVRGGATYGLGELQTDIQKNEYYFENLRFQHEITKTKYEHDLRAADKAAENAAAAEKEKREKYQTWYNKGEQKLTGDLTDIDKHRLFASYGNAYRGVMDRINRNGYTYNETHAKEFLDHATEDEIKNVLTKVAKDSGVTNLNQLDFSNPAVYKIFVTYTGDQKHRASEFQKIKYDNKYTDSVVTEAPSGRAYQGRASATYTTTITAEEKRNTAMTSSDESSFLNNIGEYGEKYGKNFTGDKNNKSEFMNYLTNSATELVDYSEFNTDTHILNLSDDPNNLQQLNNRVRTSNKEEFRVVDNAGNDTGDVVSKQDVANILDGKHNVTQQWGINKKGKPYVSLVYSDGGVDKMVEIPASMLRNKDEHMAIWQFSDKDEYGESGLERGSQIAYKPRSQWTPEEEMFMKTNPLFCKKDGNGRVYTDEDGYGVLLTPKEMREVVNSSMFKSMLSNANGTKQRAGSESSDVSNAPDALSFLE